MATNTLSLSLCSSIYRPKTHSLCSLNIIPVKQTHHAQCHSSNFNSISTALLSSRRRTIRFVAEGDESTIPEEPAPVDEEEVMSSSSEVAAEQPVSVPVSPSDLLTMFFQAEGTMNETTVPAITSALQEIEGISNLKVQVVEGIASVELMKQTTIQATGVASNLVEVIQGSGFKLQTLNLSFDDEEVLVA